ncbi:MAG: glycosyltransferase family 2 protein [bacterium]|nr:glycosyltransferase family 2 protein [bacterium]
MPSTNKFHPTVENFLSLFLFGPIFFILFAIYFLFFAIASFLIYPFQRKLKINKNEKKLNGISIIIPTWNKKAMILNCLKILDKVLVDEVKIPIEILVVENGSDDGSLEALENLQLQTPLQVLPQKENLGFARAINLAAQKAQYNYLYLMNNDMEVQKGTFSELIKLAQDLLGQNKVFFGLASQVFFFDPKKKREESGKTYSAPNFGFIKIAHMLDQLNLGKNSYTLYPGGGSSLINKAAFQKLGGYDYQSYKPLYVEDLDLGFNAWQFGFPSYFCANSQIIHHHRSSTKNSNYNPDFIIQKNFLAFIWKNFASFSDNCRHLFFYPLMMFRYTKYRHYLEALLPNLGQIFYQRLKLLPFKRIYKNKDIINFVNFEIKNET